MIELDRRGRTLVLTCDSDTAGRLQHLLCVARPRGAAEHGELRVVVVDDAPPPEPQPKHTPIEAR